jgi:hypothetical protein
LFISWDPRLSFPDTSSALVDVLSSMNEHYGAGWAETFAKVGQLSRQPLVYGNSNVGNKTALLSGIAYLQGWDTWSELSTTLNFANSQPAKVQFFEMQNLPFLRPKFEDVLAVLNVTDQMMRECLNLIATQFAQSKSSGSLMMEELLDIANITSLRSNQVLNLAIVAHERTHGTSWNKAEEALNGAIEIMARRMKHINVIEFVLFCFVLFVVLFVCII